MKRNKRQTLRRSKRNASQSCSQTLDSSPTFGVRNGVDCSPAKQYYFDSQSTNSQTDICDVGWQSSSPITLTQAVRMGQDDEYAEEREAAIKKLVEKQSAVPTVQPRTPPLHELIIDQRIEPERTRTTLQSSGSQRRGRPKGIKDAITKKEFISNFGAFVEQSRQTLSRNNEQKENVAETGSSADVSTTLEIVEPFKSPKNFPDSEPLFTPAENQSFELVTSTQIHKDSSGNTSLLNRKGSPQTIRKLDGSPLVPGKGLIRKVVARSGMSPNCTSSPVRSPLAQKNNEINCEDLWTDEEMFDDSFILKATQADMFATPKSAKRLKADTSKSSAKTSKTFISDALSPIRSANATFGSSHLQETDSDSKQKPFQSYYNKNKSLADASNLHNRSTVDCSPNARRQTQNLDSSNKPVTVPVKNLQSHTVPCVQSRYETSTLLSKTAAVISKKPVVNSAGPTKSMVHQPNNMNKPMHSVGRRDLPANSAQDHSKGAQLKQTVPLANSQKLLRSVHTNRISQSGMAASSGTAPKPKASSMIKPCSASSSVAKSSATSSMINPTRASGSASNRPPPPATTTVPTVPSHVQSNNGKERLNASITDDLLAALAEPDEILDSQMAEKDSGDNLLLMVEDLIEIGSESTRTNDVSKLKSATETDDFFANDEDDPQLLAVLDEAETQHSQEKKEHSAAKGVTGASVQLQTMNENSSRSQMVRSYPGSRSETIRNRLAASTVSDSKTRSQPPRKASQVYSASQTKVGGSSYTFKKTAKTQSFSCDQAGIAQQTMLKGSSTDKPPNQTSTSSQSSTCSSTGSGSQRCSPEEIQRKRREAMLRRQNRLKLKK